MSELTDVVGFEDVWRPPVRPQRRRPAALLGGASPAAAMRARLARVVARTPEVMVKITGRTRDPAHLAAHLNYITRDGDLPAEDRDGLAIVGRREVLELAQDWSAIQLADPWRRVSSPFSLSIVLSMPRDTDALKLRDAARAFAQSAFGGRFDYAWVLHTDAGHPHVHLAVRALGEHGERLNPRKADLERWRQVFAEALRERGVPAEATPRRARGVTRKAERTPVRKLRERHARGQGPVGRLARDAYLDAAQAAFGGADDPRPWEKALWRRNVRVRALYLAQAKVLAGSADPADRALARSVEAFVRTMPAPDTQRLALARDLRAANAALGRSRGRGDVGRSP